MRRGWKASVTRQPTTIGFTLSIDIFIGNRSNGGEQHRLYFAGAPVYNVYLTKEG